MLGQVSVMQFRYRLLIWLTVCLLAGFLLTTLASYFTSRQSIRSAIVDTELPLTADNIYSEIQRDLVQPVLISSLMANDTFVRQWVLQGERELPALTHYLAEIKREYHTITAFFISEKTQRYYHADGKHRDVNIDREADGWYFHARDMSAPYEINVDSDTANANTLTVFINHRVLDFNGQFIGVTGVGLTVAQLDTRIRDYRQKYGRDIFLSDHNGKIVLSVSEQFKSNTLVHDYPVLEKWPIDNVNGASNSLQYQLGGETHLITARHLPALNWTIYVDKAEAPALKSIQRTLLINILVSVTVTLVVLFLVHRIVWHYQQRLEHLAVTDSLTGLYNRLGFNLLLQQFLAELKRETRPACALMIDLDYFKTINDEYGHLIGDQVLREVAKQICDSVRASDIACRWGGEEFLIMARDCLRDDAQLLAEKIAGAIREHRVETAQAAIHVSVSIGISEWRRDDTVVTFFDRADQALLLAKRNGRDRVAIYDEQ